MEAATETWIGFDHEMSLDSDEAAASSYADDALVAVN
jgi:hypothetical protein